MLEWAPSHVSYKPNAKRPHARMSAHVRLHEHTYLVTYECYRSVYSLDMFWDKKI